MIADIRRIVAGLARIGYTGADMTGLGVACMMAATLVAAPVHAQSIRITAPAFASTPLIISTPLRC